MYRIDNRYASVLPPMPTAASTPGYFTEGNPQTGVSSAGADPRRGRYAVAW